MNSEEEAEFLSKAKPEALAAQVVIYRLLGIRKEISIKCMAELERRKAEENLEFDYKKYIDEELANSPSPKLDKQQQGLLKSLFGLDLNKL